MNRTRIKPMSDKRRRENVEFAKVREFVMERDGHQCRFPWTDAFVVWDCRGQLDPHHIVTVARDSTLRLEPTNLVTLCRKHHDWVHDHPAEATERGLLKSAGAVGAPLGLKGVGE